MKLIHFSLALNFIFIAALLFIIIQYRIRIYQRLFPHTDKNTTIVMLGTSITAMGDWEKVLDRKDIVNSGMHGYTTSQYIPFLDEAILKYKPKVCFIEGGINDIITGIPIKRTFENFIVISTWLKDRNIIPVIQSTPYTEYSAEQNKMIDSLNVQLKEYAYTHQIEYIDLNTVLSDGVHLKHAYSDGGIHLNEQGYIPWASQIKIVLKKYKL